MIPPRQQPNGSDGVLGAAAASTATIDATMHTHALCARVYADYISVARGMKNLTL
jgi:hypothetical protein